MFNCCSFGTMFPGGKCPNVKCCEEKNLDGCFDCPELEKCEKGFYTPSNDGAAASKAQAILGQSVEEGIRILEENLQI